MFRANCYSKYSYMFVGFVHPSPALHLQYWQHRISLIRHGHTFSFEHFKQLHGAGKSSGREGSLDKTGSRLPSSSRNNP